jgi:hypothetical protein
MKERVVDEQKAEHNKLKVSAKKRQYHEICWYTKTRFIGNGKTTI